MKAAVLKCNLEPEEDSPCFEALPEHVGHDVAVYILHADKQVHSSLSFIFHWVACAAVLSISLIDV